MIYLSASDSLRITSSVATTLHVAVHTSASDKLHLSRREVRNVLGTSPTVIAEPPSPTKVVHNLSVMNVSGAVTTVVLDIFNAVSTVLFKAELGVGESLRYLSNGNFAILSEKGELKTYSYLPEVNVTSVTNSTTLSALNTNQWKAAIARDTGSLYIFETTNLSAEITSGDPRYIAPDTDPTGASGAWVQKTAPTPVPFLEDARKTLRVNSAGTGWEFSDRDYRIWFCYSQSNFARSNVYDTSQLPTNLFVWNGGVNAAVGTAFVSARSLGLMRLPIAAAIRAAEEHPDIDYYVVICATGGVGVRAVVGMDYQWDTGLSGDPGLGGIAFDSATMGSVTQVRYNETDNGGWVRFIGGSHLGISALTPARIEVAANPAIFVEFTTSTVTDSGAYRSQPVTVTTSASWPPADGTLVTVYPAQDRLRTVISSNLETAFNSLGLVGDNRVLDKIWLWPTEADLNYVDAYFNRDHPNLREFLKTWTFAGTQFTYTLPWPWTTSAPVQVQRWWYSLEELVAKETSISKILNLQSSPITDWESGANDYIHVDSAEDQLRVGTLMYESDERGGMSVPIGFGSNTPWKPSITLITNLDTATSQGGYWQKDGREIRYNLAITIDPTASGAITEGAIDLPIASDFKNAFDAAGVVVSSVNNYTGRVYADTINKRLHFRLSSESTSAYSITLMGSYWLN